MLTGHELSTLLERQGLDFFTGVPCSLVEGVIASLEAHPRLPYVPAVREDIAVGIAAGAALAGRAPAVLMQNSGLGTSLNALASLSLMYRLPALLVVTWRGYAGKDAPEHLLMGAISPGLLDLLRIPHRALTPERLAEDLAWAHAESIHRSQPVALLLPAGVVENPATRAAGVAWSTGGNGTEPAAPRSSPDLAPPRISRRQALGAAVAALGTEPVIHANGYVCRESFAVKDRLENFYMLGSMGLASSIALGIALALPARKTVIFDGDGNLLMNLGILPMVGGGPLATGGRVGNLVHVVFDNGVYGSTGNQLSPSRLVRLDQVARASGYPRALAVSTEREITEAMRRALDEDGPTFILARVTPEEHPAPRIPYTPEEMRDRFQAALRGRR